MTHKYTLSSGKDQVLWAYEDGVSSIESIAASIDDWDCPTPCPGWNCADLAGHLLAIAKYYHRLLDAALAGRPLRNLPRNERLRAMNAADLAGLPDQSGEERTGEFVSLARQFEARLDAADWRLVLGEWDDLGDLTIEEHARAAVIEWHVHAWDLARSVGRDHRPHDLRVVAAGSGLPIAASADPWADVLRATGRHPDDHSRSE